MWAWIIFFTILRSAFADEDDFRIVKLDSGVVRGDKYWNGDYYEFYGIPYASIPTGRNRFKGPAPVKPWDGVLAASRSNILCHQCYYTEDTDDDFLLAGEDDCLTMNVLVPTSVDENKLAPVIVYIHSGAFAGGSGNMAKFGYLARHDIVVVSFNYRVGAYGFACLGTEEIPGNAGLKDQVAALRWIKRNIRKFGGDPDKVTLAGFSVGAAMAELLALSKTTDGLFHQLILESGSALSPFTINRDPVSTAWNIALSLGYNGTADIHELSDFYLNADTREVAVKSLNFFLPNSTFGFAPCIEKVQDGVEAIVTESPLDTLKRGDYRYIPVLTGFANMEGLSRSIKFGEWRERMNENFADFLPADLKFPNEKVKDNVIREIKGRYFNNKDLTADSLAKYVDYFSDIMFKYSIMKSAKLHARASKNPVYLYEFSYVGKLNIQHHYMDRLKGASHRDQTAYILDFFGFTNNYKDLDTRERMTTMWSDYVKYGDPTEIESPLITLKWTPYSEKTQKYLEINKRLQEKQGLLNDEYSFWDDIYEKYYWNPTHVNPEVIKIYHRESKVNSNVDVNKIDKPHNGNEINKKENNMNKDIEKEDGDETLKGEKKIRSNLKSTTTIKSLDKDGKLITKVINNLEQKGNVDNVEKQDVVETDKNIKA